MKTTKYFYGQGSNGNYTPIEAITSATKERDLFLAAHKETIEEIAEESIQIAPLVANFREFYCVIKLTYYPKTEI